MFSAGATTGSFSFPKTLLSGVTRFGAETAAIAQSTRFGFVKLIGTNAESLAMTSAGIVPPSKGPGCRTESPCAAWFTFARTWLLLKMWSFPAFFTRQPIVPAVILKCPTETPPGAGRYRPLNGNASISPISTTSVRTPPTFSGTRADSCTSSIGSFAATYTVTHVSSVNQPATTLSPMPTPLMFSKPCVSVPLSADKASSTTLRMKFCSSFRLAPSRPFGTPGADFLRVVCAIFSPCGGIECKSECCGRAS